jgi:hypothetical protein
MASRRLPLVTVMIVWLLCIVRNGKTFVCRIMESRCRLGSGDKGKLRSKSAVNPELPVRLVAGAGGRRGEAFLTIAIAWSEDLAIGGTLQRLISFIVRAHDDGFGKSESLDLSGVT